MKREDSKRHYKEENHVLKKELILSSILLYLFLSVNIFSQVPINGFCNLTEISVKPNYTSIAAIDFSVDGYRDLVLYNQSINSYCTIMANSRKGFSKPIERFSSFYLSDLKSFTNDKYGKKYLAVSRRTREAGVVSFSKSGSFSINTKLKIDGSPATQDAGKIEDGLAPTILYSGTGIDGLVLAKPQNGKPKEIDRIKGKIFSAALFLDLNYDGYDDIAAVDLVSNALVFYNNDAFGSFEETRSIGLGAEIRNLNKIDFNSDKFTDIIYTKNNKLEVLLGDSVSSFQKKVVINTEHGIEKYSIMDFNGDGYNDIAFINNKKTKLFIMYAKTESSYYEPISYIVKDNLSDVISYVDRGGRKLAALSSDGSLYVISSLSMHDDFFKLAVSEKAVSVESFDYNSDGFKELVFIDAESHSLKIGLSEHRNLFRIFYSINLSTDPNQLIIDDSKRNETTFICYKSGSREIEVIRYNFEKNRMNKQILYTDSPIKEVKHLSDRLKDRIRICALTISNKILSLQEFELRNFGTSSVERWQISRNVEDASFNFNVYKDIYAMIRLGNNVDLVKIVFDKKEIERIPRITFQLDEGETIESQLVCVNQLIYRTKPAAALLTFKKKSVFYYFWNEKNTRIETRATHAYNMSLRYSINEEKIVFYSLTGSNNVLNILPSEKSTKTSARIEEKQINNYFVVTLYGNNKFLVYTSTNSNSITISKLK